ncbi:hypothetical protein FA95DRAFT_1662655 [Auriscalpium vulgare]|uniref:Uncharacterized protein n=1 Tax=Auriscalpium vulgare TaxID=40419 RepID=A0ACB8RU16_9AGAM|nr:hypothetical protein FA95DRAFT_1662655 [Auriscalpium vulgare]
MSTTQTLPPAIIDEIVSGLHIANGIRYLSAIGLTILLYDHLLTFADEIQYIWKAPRSWAKYVFLANRYTVAALLIAAAHEMCGFNGVKYSHTVLLSALSVVSVFSISSANLLVYIRVLLLWDKQPRVLVLLSVFFVVTTLTVTGCMIASAIILIPSVEWSDLAHICTLTKSSRIFVSVWGAPMLFEVTILGMMIYHALSQPRTARVALTSTLYRDGTSFFVVITAVRACNVAFAATADPRRMSYPVFFSWAIVTLVVNRLLIRIRSSEVKIARHDQDAFAAVADEMGLDTDADYEDAGTPAPTDPYAYKSHSPTSFAVRVDSVVVQQDELEMRRFRTASSS